MFEIKIHASGSKGNAYSIIDGDQRILIDPGICFKDLQKATGFKLSEYDFCLISHEHKDHCHAFSGIQKLGLKSIMSLGTYNALGESGQYEITHIISNPVETPDVEEILDMAPWAIMPFKTQHDAVEPFGFLIKSPSGKKICYATDTYYIQYNFPSVTHWMIECNYSEELLQKNSALPDDVKRRIRTSHFELQNVIEFFKAQDLTATEAIHLIHLSDDNSDAELFQKEIEKATGKPVYVTE